MVVEHKHKIGFSGTILIEPKPHEPTRHQYDHDVETVSDGAVTEGITPRPRSGRQELIENILGRYL